MLCPFHRCSVLSSMLCPFHWCFVLFIGATSFLSVQCPFHQGCVLDLFSPVLSPYPWCCVLSHGAGFFPPCAGSFFLAFGPFPWWVLGLFLAVLGPILRCLILFFSAGSFFPRCRVLFICAGSFSSVVGPFRVGPFSVIDAGSFSPCARSFSLLLDSFL